MIASPDIPCTAFAGLRRIAAGPLREVAPAVKCALDAGEAEPVLIFDDASGRAVEVDFRGTVDDVRRRLAEAAPVREEEDARPRGPGRPKLGVVAREVTLLPRHWDWLAAQPGGASVALRKLVEDARRANEAKDRERQAREATYRFMSTLAGDLPGFEEAARALFAGDREKLQEVTARWPGDVAAYAMRLNASGT